MEDKEAFEKAKKINWWDCHDIKDTPVEVILLKLVKAFQTMEVVRGEHNMSIEMVKWNRESSLDERLQENELKVNVYEIAGHTVEITLHEHLDYLHIIIVIGKERRVICYRKIVDEWILDQVANAYIPLPFIAKHIAIIVGVIDYLDNCGGKARAKMGQDLILEHEKEHIRQELIQHFIKIVESEVGYAR